MSRTASVALRITSAAGLLLVATYYLLASIPFSYYHFLQFPHFWWLPPFIRFHPLVLAGATLAYVATVRNAPPRARSWIRYLLIGAATTAACMTVLVVWPAAVSYELAAALSFAPVVLLAALSAIALAAEDATLAMPRGPRSFAAIAAAMTIASLCAATYFVDAALRGATESLQPKEIAFAGAASVAGHVVLFGVAALVLLGIRVAAARAKWSAAIEALAAGAWISALVAMVIRRSILTALILEDWRATTLAIVLSVALVLCWASGRSSFDRLRTSGEPSWRRALTSVAIAVVCVAILPRMLLLADWGSTIQKLLVFATWGCAASFVSAWPGSRSRRLVLGAALAAVLIATTVGASVSARARASSAPRFRERDASFDASLAIDRYGTFDTSFSVLLDVLRPTVADGDFFLTLRRAGDATEDRSLKAVPMHVIDRTERSQTATPNIFVVVVDSLRPDYLSAYNSAATFTPNIGAFANDSIVWRNAFSPYAGTALSEPAIWAGGLIPRAMYVQPFSEVNNLERLLNLAHYRRYISVDEILSVILDKSPDVQRLDAHLAHPDRRDEMFKFDICTTLGELGDDLSRDAREKPREPIFFYSQPQNLHIRVLAGNEYPRYEGVHVGGAEFFKPAVTALGRIDSCFGGFIDRLKTLGLYDDSIIVLTSDHGDAYGEAGRFGHAFYVAPETMRIPLIVHVPETVRAGRVWDANAVARLTDLTPTLYDLLGFTPTNRSGLVGRSLMRRAGTTPVPSEMFLIQSSYSRVFGLIDDRGRWMYVADANHHREQLFDLQSGDPYPKPLERAERLAYRKWLVDRLAKLDAYFGRSFAK
jgi:hypothetical protein